MNLNLLVDCLYCSYMIVLHSGLWKTLSVETSCNFPRSFYIIILLIVYVWQWSFDSEDPPPLHLLSVSGYLHQQPLIKWVVTNCIPGISLIAVMSQITWKW